MRIALMTNNYKPIVGGVPISIERLARGLKELGHEVTIFAPTYKEQRELGKIGPARTGAAAGAGKIGPARTGAAAGAGEIGPARTGAAPAEEGKDASPGHDEENVFRYATCLNHFIGGIVLPNPFDARIEREFREHPYDIIHVHHPMLIGRTAAYLSRKYHIPLVFTYHTRYEQYVRSYTKGILRVDRLMPLYLRGFLRHCNFVFAPTEGMQEYLTHACRVWPGKTGVLPTGIERGNFDVGPEEGGKIRRQYGAEKIPLLLTVSRMAHEKNVGFLLESLARVKAMYGKPFRMLVVGDGPDREALYKRSLELGLGDTVAFAGTIPNGEIAPYFKAADGFLFASKTETQGIVVLEAFAGATPVIAVKASGVEDLVEDGVDGILAKEDREEYAEKVTAFLEGVHASRMEENMLPEEAGGIFGASPIADVPGGLPAAAYRRMAANALQKGALYREEAVALKAVHYYNSVIAENAIPKKRKIRLLPTG